MRRGLISRSKAELPDAVLDARLAHRRVVMTVEEEILPLARAHLHQVSQALFHLHPQVDPGPKESRQSHAKLANEIGGTVRCAHNAPSTESPDTSPSGWVCQV